MVPGRASGRGSISTDQRFWLSTSLAVDLDAAEELQSETRGEIFALLRAAAFLKHRLRTERIIQLAGTPCPRMKRTGDEFPERLELLKHRAVRIVMVRGCVVHVRRQPHGISHAGAFHERQQIGNFVLAPLRWSVAKRNRVLADQ